MNRSIAFFAALVAATSIALGFAAHAGNDSHAEACIPVHGLTCGG